MTYVRILQESVELSAAALPPEPQGLQHDVQADSVAVAKAVDECLFRIVGADGTPSSSCVSMPSWNAGPENQKKRVGGLSSRGFVLPPSSATSMMCGTCVVQLMEREGGDEAMDTVRNARRHCQEVRMRQRL